MESRLKTWRADKGRTRGEPGEEAATSQRGPRALRRAGIALRGQQECREDGNLSEIRASRISEPGTWRSGSSASSPPPGIPWAGAGGSPQRAGVTPTSPRLKVPTWGVGSELSLRSRTRPPSGGAERWRGWGPRGRVAPQLSSARQPAGQTKGLPAKGGVISPQLGVLECELQTPDSQHLADFFFPLTPKQMWLQRGLLAPDPGAVGCFARMRRAHSAGPGRGNLVRGEGGETSGRVIAGGGVGGWMDGSTNTEAQSGQCGQNGTRTHHPLFRPCHTHLPG